MGSPYRIALIGFGLIGRQRLQAIEALIEDGINIQIIGICDPVLDSTYKNLSLSEILEMDPDLVIVSTPHDLAKNFSIKLLKTRSKLLVEKPLGRTLKEFESIAQSVIKENQLFVGFNYPYFEGIRALESDIRKNKFGEIYRLSLNMGHGGSPGDDLTWKLDPIRAGGGCLIDPGIHLFDLIYFLLDEVAEVDFCRTSSPFWKTGIEEIAICSLHTKKIGVIEVNISITQWKSTFGIKVEGSSGYGEVVGRGKSYGPQTYRRGTKWSWLNGNSQSMNEELVLETNCDASFKDEIRDLILENCDSAVWNSLARMRNAMQLVENCRKLAFI